MPIVLTLSLLATAADNKTSPASIRRVWVNPTKQFLNPNAVSSDGRFIMVAQGDRLVCYDSRDSSTRVVATGVRIFRPVISCDGRKAAFGAYPDDKVGEIYTVDLDTQGGVNSPPRRVFKNKEHPQAWPLDWFPDGGSLLIAVSDETRKSGNIAQLALADEALRIITAKHTLETWNAFVSPDGKRVLFDRSSESEGKRDVWITGLDRRETSVANTRDDERACGWIADGTAIVHSRTVDGLTAFYRASLGGGPNEKLVDEPGLAWSPVRVSAGNELLYIHHEYKTDVYTAGFDRRHSQITSQPELLIPDHRGTNGNSAWSPNGQFLIYGSLRLRRDGRPSVPAYFIREIATGNERRFVPKLTQHDSFAWWSDTTVLTLGTGEDRRTGFYLVNAETMDTEFLVRSEKWSGGFPEISPDRESIYFRVVANIQRLSVQSGVAKTVCNLGKGQIRSIRLSPDGKRIAFLYANSQDKSLMVVEADGGPTRELVRVHAPERLETGETQPIAWNGDEILFTRGSDNRMTLWSISLNGGEPRTAGLSMDGLGWMHVHPKKDRIVFFAGDQETVDLVSFAIAQPKS